MLVFQNKGGGEKNVVPIDTIAGARHWVTDQTLLKSCFLDVGRESYARIEWRFVGSIFY